MIRPAHLLILTVLLLTAACKPAQPAQAIIGATAPEIALQSAEGKAVKLSDYRGRPVIVNFWATWCTPCRAEIPALQDAMERYKKDNLVVFAVNVQEGADLVKPFTDEFEMTFPVGLDSNGDVVSLYRVRGIPTSVFIDKDGIIRSVHLGPMSAADIDAELGAFIAS